MSAENKNSLPDPSDIEYINAELDEARATVLGEEVVKRASQITHYTGEIEPREVVNEAENLTHFTGTILPDIIVEEAAVMPAYYAEVIKTGEHFEDTRSEWEDIAENMVVNEAEQLLLNHNEMEDFIVTSDKDVTVGDALDAQSKVEEHNRSMQAAIDEHVSAGPDKFRQTE